jgi:hypothetical protein
MVVAAGLQTAARAQPAGALSVSAFPSIQAALDANPGKMLFVPDGEYSLTEPVRIRHSGSGLYGFGKLVQQNTNSPIIEIAGANEVRLKDLTLTRAQGQEAARASALLAADCRHVTISGLAIRDNRAAAGAIALRSCSHAAISDCFIENYSAISIDDRTRGAQYGYAFNCIDGTGITASQCTDLLIQRNRIMENHLHPTPELKERFRLGEMVRRNPTKGLLIAQKVWDAGRVENWHQGSGIAVTTPERTAFVRILDNHIENAAQGIDVHADNVIISGNIIVNAFMGTKAMHGSRHVLIANNQFIRTDLWAIGLMPGVSSHSAELANGDKPGRPANVDAGHIIANNIITDFGYGDSHWIWHVPEHNCTPFRFDNGQEPDDPPLRDVLVTGNLVYNTGRDGVLTNGTIEKLPPRYRWAVFISREPGSPMGLKFSNNLFAPGTEGVSNVPLE